jgi:hypothetical protein
MALIAYLMEKKNNYGPHLIIVPNAVIVNWKSELMQWLPTVKCVYYVGNKVCGWGWGVSQVGSKKGGGGGYLAGLGQGGGEQAEAGGEGEFVGWLLGDGG